MDSCKSQKCTSSLVSDSCYWGAIGSDHTRAATGPFVLEIKTVLKLLLRGIQGQRGLLGLC